LDASNSEQNLCGDQLLHASGWLAVHAYTQNGQRCEHIAQYRWPEMTHDHHL
jgi:hypothetical protein